MKLSGTHSAHLTYCLNVHAGEAWEDQVTAIQEHAMAVRDVVSPAHPFGLGLRIGNAASLALQAPGMVAEFRDFLDANDLYVFTANAFPFGAFHGERVKDGAYRPDWRSQERVDYTKRVATALAGMLPDGVEGSISTVPLSYKPWGLDAADGALMVQNLLAVAEHLERLAETRGTVISLALEPEPDCLLEKTEEAITFFESLALSAPEQARFRRFIGVCFDTCHASVQFENLVQGLRSLVAAGIRVPKIQLSAALRATDGPDTRRALAPFCDPVYLHQVRRRTSAGEVVGHPDLEPALQSIPPGHDEWRVHFHVPLYYRGAAPLRSTAGDLSPEFFAAVAECGIEQLEIETYTFDVLPELLRSRGVVASVCDEFAWVREQIGWARSV